MKKTGFISHESFFWHNTGNGSLFLPPGGWVEPNIHAENPATKRRFKNLLELSGLYDQLEKISPRTSTREELEYFHTAEYIDNIKKLSDQTGGDAGELSLFGKGSFEIAKLATGGAITATDAVMNGDVDNVYALIRPCGHHAERDRGMGFCIFNHVAIAAKYAKKKYGLKRILIVDWDVHHGNGTEQAFYDDPDVLFVSLHQELNYPANSGLVEHTGEGKGEGYNINIPLPAGTGNAGYMHAFEQIIGPIAEEFKPELIYISAGQDASNYDPLGRMMVDAEGYYQLANFMKKLAENHCDGKLIACHEGGYSADYVPFCSLRIVEAMSEINTPVEDPYKINTPATTYIVTEGQKKLVEDVIKVHSNYWSFGKMSV
ncbi:class II histone deacetylase [Alkalihalophilus pseudofirmus]|nr:class II histone deacetylase [Alkalihalophilus pseudofirmus]